MTEERNVKHQVGNGMLIGAAVISVPGIRAIVGGDLGIGAAFLVIPVVLAAVGLSLKTAAIWVPLVTGGVLTAVLLGIAVVAPDASETTLPTSVSPVSVKLAGTPPAAAMPVTNETDWLPASDQVPAAAQSQYDDYVTLFADYTQAQQKATQAQAAYKGAIKNYAATKKKYQQGQVSYSAVTNSYDQMQHQRDASTAAAAAANDLATQVVEARIALAQLFVGT